MGCEGKTFSDKPIYTCNIYVQLKKHSNIPHNRQASRLKDKDTSPSLGTSHVPELFRHRTVQDREEMFESRKGLFNIHRLKTDQNATCKQTTKNGPMPCRDAVFLFGAMMKRFLWIDLGEMQQVTLEAMGIL